MKVTASRRKYSIAVVLVVCLQLPVVAAHETACASNENTHLSAKPESLEWWRNSRFGMFIHWGPVSLKGTEISWSRAGERRGATRHEKAAGGEIPTEEYDNLFRSFDPVKFDAREWVALAQAAGMKYLVFTSKHHDGFSMFDSALTEHKITNSPFARDVVGELAEACHDAGLRFGVYYSPPDWHHSDYRTENHQRYIDFLHGQIRELCTNYGRVDIIWFDGLRCTPEDWDSDKMFGMIRELQPHILINNRAGLPGDFDTPEQTVGRYQIDRPWESCMTIARQWAWRPDDTVKPLKECIEILVRCAGGDGNLLLNVGPTPLGEIEPDQVERLKEIGTWLKSNGTAIYGTRGGPFQPDHWGASTHRGNTIYLHILDWSEETLVFPTIKGQIVSSSILGTEEGDALVRVKQSSDRIEVQVTRSGRHPLDTIVVLEMDEPVAQIQPGPATSEGPGGE